MNIPEIVLTQAPLAGLFALFAIALIGVLIRFIDKTNDKFMNALKEQRKEFSQALEIVTDKIGCDVMDELKKINNKLDKRRGL